jgi:hypothetical protein
MAFKTASKWLRFGTLLLALGGGLPAMGVMSYGHGLLLSGPGAVLCVIGYLKVKDRSSLS